MQKCSAVGSRLVSCRIYSIGHELEGDSRHRQLTPKYDKPGWRQDCAYKSQAMPQAYSKGKDPCSAIKPFYAPYAEERDANR